MNARATRDPFDLLASRRTQGALLLGAALALALLSSRHVAENLSARGHATSFRSVFLAELVEWMLWAAVVPIVMGVERRWGVRPRGWVRGLSAHLLAALILYLAINSVIAPLSLVLGLSAPAPLGTVLLRRALARSPEAAGIYGSIAAAIWILSLLRDRAEDRARAARLEADLADANLRTLRDRLQPHFLFNTLNMIAGLVRHRRDAQAVLMINGLSELLRHSLRQLDRPLVTLREEIDALEHYLAIQRARFEDALSVTQEVGEGAMSALLPPFLLQPLVENAVMHGLEGNQGGKVVLRAEVRAGRLRLEVEDDGTGLTTVVTEGTGLGVTRERLRVIYGDAATLTLIGTASGGARTIVEMPLHAP